MRGGDGFRSRGNVGGRLPQDQLAEIILMRQMKDLPATAEERKGEGMPGLFDEIAKDAPGLVAINQSGPHEKRAEGLEPLFNFQLRAAVQGLAALERAHARDKHQPRNSGRAGGLEQFFRAEHIDGVNLFPIVQREIMGAMNERVGSR